MKSYFLNSKDGRKPLKESVIRALLPTEKEKPKMDKEEKEKEDKADKNPGNGGNKANGTMAGPPEVIVSIPIQAHQCH